MTQQFEPTPQQENDAECIVPRGLRRGRKIEEIITELRSLGWPQEDAAEYVNKAQQDIAKQRAQDAIPRSERPLLITILCLGTFVTAPLTLITAFSHSAQNVAPWYPYLLSFALVCGLVCMIGLWKMRRWAFWAYLIFCAVGQVILLAIGFWKLEGVVFPAAFITVMLCYFGRMR